MKALSSTHRFTTLLLTLVAGLAIFSGGCSSDPDISELANQMCTCEQFFDNETFTPEQRTACRTEMTTYLDAQPDSCLECLDGKVGESATAATCATANPSCPTCAD